MLTHHPFYLSQAGSRRTGTLRRITLTCIKPTTSSEQFHSQTSVSANPLESPS